MDRAAYDHLVSIGDPTESLPKGYRGFKGKKIRFEFDDITKPMDDATMASVVDVERLIAFLDNMNGAALIHCYAGISRSAAAACILATLKLGAGKEREALSHVEKHKPSIWPNKHILNIADQLLDRKGALLDAAFHLWPQPRDNGDVALIEIATIPRLGVHGL